MKIVNLAFKQTLVSLAGNPFGKKTFEEQVKPYLKEETDFCIIFPDHIEMIASSFVQGFFAYWLNSLGIDGVFRHIKVQARNEDIVKRVYDNLL